MHDLFILFEFFVNMVSKRVLDATIAAPGRELVQPQGPVEIKPKVRLGWYFLKAGTMHLP